MYAYSSSEVRREKNTVEIVEIFGIWTCTVLTLNQAPSVTTGQWWFAYLHWSNCKHIHATTCECFLWHTACFMNPFYSFGTGKVTCHSCTQNLRGKNTKRLFLKEYAFMYIIQKCLWTAVLTQKRHHCVIEAFPLLTWSNFLQFFSAPFALPPNPFCQKACWLCLVLHLLNIS